MSYNINIIKEKVELIQKSIKKIEYNGIKDPFQIELILMDEYPDFYQSYPFIVKKLCKKDDISMLYQMFNNLEKVETGNKSLASVELDLGDKLAKLYIKS